MSDVIAIDLRSMKANTTIVLSETDPDWRSSKMGLAKVPPFLSSQLIDSDGANAVKAHLDASF
jgi:hypothetical protein